ncbi:MAG TPA: 3-phosphoshikimate 1-carboxyvinyltransferase [Pirellulales bacterium]|jgi:3-phosphoshikimate 1-carboxyvinyltransferase|nr:3-phosphoshikimate 1-carboxyvinyltransferase [Pirellulales bacterium]
MSDDEIEILPRGPVHASLRPPGSKSITNRALVCAALAEGRSTLSGALDSEDTRVMIEALAKLGVDIEARLAEAVVEVEGCGGRLPAREGELYVANSGTTVRFLAALIGLAEGKFRLDGTSRMRERPIGDLIESLRQLGVEARAESAGNCPPVVIRAAGLKGGRATVRGDVSSQFLSGLLLAAPYASQPVTLTVEGELVSQPYVAMTLAVMEAFGVEVSQDGLREFRLPRARYRARPYAIEPDASAASYFFAAAAILGGDVTVEGLSKTSLQGDVAFVDMLERMGCRVYYGTDQIRVTGGSLKGITVNMNGISDTVQTLGAVALFAEGPTTITGVGHIRHKETDRIGALATELRKLGASVEELSDGLRITPGALRGAAIDTYHDHRMAMSLALVGLRQPRVVIRDPGCTAKTYPGFWHDLRSLG